MSNDSNTNDRIASEQNNRIAFILKEFTLQ